MSDPVKEYMAEFGGHWPRTAQSVEMAAELNGDPIPQPMTADQQIRAKALECAAIYGADIGDWINFEDLLDKFERYIRDGK